MSDLYLFFTLAMIGGLFVIAVTVVLIIRKLKAPNAVLKQKVESLEKEMDDLKSKI